MIKLPNVRGLVSMTKALVMANRPELLFGASITATVGAVLLAAKGGYDARGKLEVVAMEQNKDVTEIPVKEKVNLTWLCYMPAAVTTLGALGSTTGLHLVHIQEKKALAQSALVAIEEVKETARQFEKDNIGVVSQEERSKILEERAKNTPIGENGSAHQEYSDGFLEELYPVRDAKTGRDIFSNEQRIEEAVLHLNNLLAKEGSASLNEFYEKAGFSMIPEGEDWGWSGVWVELEWKASVRDDGRPVREFSFRPVAKSDYVYGNEQH